MEELFRSLVQSISDCRKGIITDYSDTEALIKESEELLQKAGNLLNIEIPTLEDVRRKVEK